MKIMARNTLVIISVLFCHAAFVKAQLSPGDLSVAHSSLEGLSNCTQCHLLGNKVSVDKCLSCHTELRERIAAQKGYHSSPDVKGKMCFSCHSEHNGKNFQLIRLDPLKFDHSLTGYKLSTPHSAKQCRECHIPKNIEDPKLRARKNTYLGLSSECLACHTDYHQQTLSAQCLNCHTEESFKQAPRFDHKNARFQLKGRHQNVDCLKCHKTETVNGKKFQQFRGIQFANCTSCHKDPHANKFGQNCRQCHTEESFRSVRAGGSFDHSKTAFPLVEKHQIVDCKSCHKAKYTDPLKHDKCTDCHSDYHNGQFAKNGLSPDCSQCHSVKGFTYFSYTIEQHNSSVFQLKGSHQATPCTDCHKKLEKWSFRGIGTNCSNCHKDIHSRIIQAKYYPEANCRACHNENRWAEITFNHSLTKFPLTGVHEKLSCRACHFRADSKGVVQQRFYELSANCSSCHSDRHYGQFEKNGITNCTDCHDTWNWKASKFDHNNAAFKLDGKHVNVPCAKCHKPQQEGTAFYVKYKLKEFKCESCHL